MLAFMDQIVVFYLCIFLLSAALLYDQVMKRIPTRLRANQAPKSGFGLIAAAEYGLPARAQGVE